MSMKKVVVSITIDENVARELRAQSEIQDRPMSRIVNRALAEHFAAARSEI